MKIAHSFLHKHHSVRGAIHKQHHHFLLYRGGEGNNWGAILMTNTYKIRGGAQKNIKEKLMTSFMDSSWWVLFFSLLFLEFLEIWETLKRLWNGRNPIFIIHIKTAKDEKEKEIQNYQGYLKYVFFLLQNPNPNTYVLFIYV